MMGERPALDAFLETTDDPVVILDADDHVRRCNEAARTLTGMHDEWKGRPVSSFFESIPALVARLERESDDSGVVEITADSESRYFEVTSRPISQIEAGAAADGRVVRLEDSTRVHRQERELTRLERRYATLFETDQLVLWVQDFSAAKAYAERLAADVEDFEAYLEEHPDELAAIFNRIDVIDANEYALEFYGADSKAELEANLGRLLTDEGIQEIRTILAGMLDGQRRFRMECVASSLDGEQRPEILEITVPEGCEDYSRVYTSTLDITERKEREQALQEVKERYQRILDYASDYVLICDEEGTIDYISPGVEDTLGYEPNTLVGTDAFELIHPADTDDVQQTSAAMLEDPSAERTVEYRVQGADGEYRWMEARGSNCLDDPLIDGILVTIRDVTERKRREEELRRKTELLDEFARVVSHDVTTPLGVIENKARLIEITGETSHATDIYEASKRVQDLIDELESLAREGTQVNRVSSVDLEEVATDAWTTVGTPTGSLTVESSASIDADRGQLRQLLENLFANAVDHGDPAIAADQTQGNGNATSPDANLPDEGLGAETTDTDTDIDASVKVRVGVSSDGFYVADDGPGIPAEDRDVVFDEGYTTDTESTGFGLAIVRRIVEAHGWTVAVTESDTGGARFEIRTETEIHGADPK